MADEQVTKAVASIDELIALEQRKIGLLADMVKCLLLAEIIGVAPKDLTGPVSVRAEVRSAFRPRVGGTIFITYDGKTIERPLKDVPERVWPATARAPGNRDVQLRKPL